MLVIVAPVSSSRLLALLAGAWTAAAALVSSGGIAFTGSAPGASDGSIGARFGVIPFDAAHLALAALAGLIVAALGWRGGRGRAVAIAVSPLALTFLPWLPGSVPAAFLAWNGALATLAWIGAAIALIASATPDLAGLWRAKPVAGFPAVLAAIIFSAAAWAASPSIPGGDEPHYLVITQSLLYDRDLAIENNHRRGDYHAYFAGELLPDAIKRGRDGQIYSIHAPGVPALVAPAFAIGGYHAVVIFIILVAAAASGLAWWLAWRVTGDRASAWFGWAAVVFAAPFLLETFTVYPDGLGAAVVLTGFWALLRAEWESEPHAAASNWRPWFFHGLALALLPWMHTRFAVLAGTLGGLVLLRVARALNPVAKAIAFLSAPAVSAVAWLFFFTILYGAPDPSAPYGGRLDNSFAFLPNGLGGILFDQGFGLLATAPVLAVALAGFARTRRLALEWAVVAAPYVLSVATFAMWWAGSSGPARFLVPLLMPLAIPAACAWSAARSRGARSVMLAALVVSAWLSAIMAGGGGGTLGYHTRNEAGLTAAPWMEWATPVVNLPSAFPAFVPQPTQPDPGGRVSRANAARSGFAATIPWLLSLGVVAALLIWWINRRPPATASMIAGTTIGFGAAAMIAMSIVWRVQAADPITTTAGQMNVLRRLASDRVLPVDLSHVRRLSRDEASAMRIQVPVVRRRAGGRLNLPLAAFPAVPAGSYEIAVRRQGTGDGWIMIGVGNDQFAIVTQPIASFDRGVRVTLPVPVRALLVRADEGARDQLRAIELRPGNAQAGGVATDVARRAVRYDRAAVFFLDDRAFPEPSGFWVAGARQTAVAVQPDPGSAVSLLLRNGARENVVSLESGSWRDEFSMSAGETRRVALPAAPGAAAVIRIRSAQSFRPSDVDPNSRDTRSLGVFVQILD